MPNIYPPFNLNYDYLDELHANRDYNLYNPQHIKNRRHEYVQLSTDGKVIRLQDKTQLDIVSIVVMELVNYNGSEFYEIKLTKSTTPRSKFLSYLFELILVEFKYTIISDETHTSPGSKEYWISLKRKEKYELFIYNIDTNYKRKYINVSEDKIWGLTDEYLEQINGILFEVRDYEVFEPNYEQSESYDFEGFDDIDMDVLDASIATKEIYNFVRNHKDNIRNNKNIRLVAQLVV